MNENITIAAAVPMVMAAGCSLVRDALTECLRNCARQMLTLAIDAEVHERIGRHALVKEAGGRLAIVFKLCESAAKTWRALIGASLLPDVIAGVQFINGEKPQKSAA